MSKQWTNKELKECKRLYSEKGLKAAVRYTKRSKKAVTSYMQLTGTRCKHQSELSQREKINFSVNDVVEMFELSASGISRRLIAEYMNCSASMINKTINLAKEHGMSRFQGAT
jgi:hypothetical protein